MFSQDECQGTFCLSPVINFTPEAIALINHTLLGHFKPHPVVQIHYDRCSSLPISTPQPRFTLFYFTPQSIPLLSSLLHWDRHSLISTVLIGTPLFHFVVLSLRCELLHSHRHLSAGIALLNPHQYSSAWAGTPLIHSALLTPPPPLSVLLIPFCCSAA